MQHLPEKSRLQFLDSYVAPCLFYRASGWPPQPTMKQTVDRFQIRLTAQLLPVRRDACESDDQFFRRRAHIVSTKIKKHGLWSDKWFTRALSWHDHVLRNHNGRIWSAHILAVRDSNWLAARRATFAPTISTALRPWTALAGRLNLRTNRGRPSIRWEDSILDARRTHRER